MTAQTADAITRPGTDRHRPAAAEPGATGRELVGFGPALASRRTLLVREDGTTVALAVRRWHGPATRADSWLLDRCHGPVLDLGCGPGRLVAALVRRGIPALGVDVSANAADHCRRKRVPVLHADLFGPLPGEGHWHHVLLADGNIGIGGDPVRLLRRAVELLRPGGTVLVETDPRPRVWWSETVRLRTRHGLGEPIPWAVVGHGTLPDLAAAAGLAATATHRGTRCFAELTAPSAASALS